MLSGNTIKYYRLLRLELLVYMIIITLANDKEWVYDFTIKVMNVLLWVTCIILNCVITFIQINNVVKVKAAVFVFVIIILNILCNTCLFSQVAQTFQENRLGLIILILNNVLLYFSAEGFLIRISKRICRSVPVDQLLGVVTGIGCLCLDINLFYVWRRQFSHGLYCLCEFNARLFTLEFEFKHSCTSICCYFKYEDFDIRHFLAYSYLITIWQISTLSFMSDILFEVDIPANTPDYLATIMPFFKKYTKPENVRYIIRRNLERSYPNELKKARLIALTEYALHADYICAELFTDEGIEMTSQMLKKGYIGRANNSVNEDVEDFIKTVIAVKHELDIRYSTVETDFNASFTKTVKETRDFQRSINGLKRLWMLFHLLTIPWYLLVLYIQYEFNVFETEYKNAIQNTEIFIIAPCIRTTTALLIVPEISFLFKTLYVHTMPKRPKTLGYKLLIITASLIFICLIIFLYCFLSSKHHKSSNSNDLREQFQSSCGYRESKDFYETGRSHARSVYTAEDIQLVGNFKFSEMAEVPSELDISWTFNGKPIPEEKWKNEMSQNILVVHEDLYINTSLSLNFVQSTDYGKYRCRVSLYYAEATDRCKKSDFIEYRLLDPLKNKPSCNVFSGDFVIIPAFQFETFPDTEVNFHYTINGLDADNICLELGSCSLTGYLRNIYLSELLPLPASNTVFQDSSGRRMEVILFVCACGQVYGEHKLEIIRDFYNRTSREIELILVNQPVTFFIYPEYWSIALLARKCSFYTKGIVNYFKNIFNKYITNVLYLWLFLWILALVVALILDLCKYLNKLRSQRTPVPIMQRLRDLQTGVKVKYDVFLSSCADDYDFAKNVILPFLEEVCKLKVCFPERDLAHIVGVSSIRLYKTVTQQSLKYVIIFSTGYIEDTDCNDIQFNTCILPLIISTKRHWSDLIVIVTDEIKEMETLGILEQIRWNPNVYIIDWFAVNDEKYKLNKLRKRLSRL